MVQAFDLQGHRGARGLYPENTLSGFIGAITLGLSAFELDVAVTADDVLVVSHDPLLNPNITRGPDGAWLAAPTPSIRSLTLAELRTYDVGRIRPGTFYAAAFPDQQPQDGARIPTLTEVLALDPHIRVSVEMKTFPNRPNLTVSPQCMAELLVAAVDAMAAAARVTVQSFDWRGLRYLRQFRPDISLAWLTQSQPDRERRLWWDRVSAADYRGSVPHAVAAEGGPTWVPEGKELSRASVAEAHQLGLRVVPWGVNRPARMERLLRWEVDGLITDRPDLALNVIRRAHAETQVRREDC